MTKVTWDYLLSICSLFCVYVCILTLCLCSSLCNCVSVAKTFLLCSSIFCVENKGSRSDINWLAPVRMHVTYFKSQTGIIDRKLLKFSWQFVIMGKLRTMTLTLSSIAWHFANQGLWFGFFNSWDYLLYLNHSIYL